MRSPLCFYLAVALLLGFADSGFATGPDIFVDVRAALLGDAAGRNGVPLSPPPSGDNHPMPGLPAGKNSIFLNEKVGLRVETRADGTIENVTVVQPSKSRLLNEYGRTWVQVVWRYPADARKRTHLETISFHRTPEEDRSEAQAVQFGRNNAPNTPRPPYPGVAIWQHWQGDVGLLLSPAGSGAVKEATITRSSGKLLLDLQTQAWAMAYWKLPGNTPATALVHFHLVTYPPGSLKRINYVSVPR